MDLVTNEQAVAALRKLIEEHDLTQREIAELACVSIKTVESWLAQPGAANHRSMHARHLRAVHHFLPALLRRRKGKK